MPYPTMPKTYHLAVLARSKLSTALTTRPAHLRIAVLHANFLERVMCRIEEEARDFVWGVRTTGVAEGAGFCWEGWEREMVEGEWLNGIVEGWREVAEGEDEEEEREEAEGWRRGGEVALEEEGDDLFTNFVDGLWEERFPPVFEESDPDLHPHALPPPSAPTSPTTPPTLSKLALHTPRHHSHHHYPLLPRTLTRLFTRAPELDPILPFSHPPHPAAVAAAPVVGF